MCDNAAFECFKLYYATLGSLQAGAFDNAIKVVASLLLVMGWLISSDKAREFLAGRSAIGKLGAVVILWCSGVFCWFYWRLYLMSSEVAQLMSGIKGTTPEMYQHSVLSGNTLFLLGLADFAVSVITVVLLITVTNVKPTTIAAPSDGAKK